MAATDTQHTTQTTCTEGDESMTPGSTGSGSPARTASPWATCEPSPGRCTDHAPGASDAARAAVRYRQNAMPLLGCPAPPVRGQLVLGAGQVD